MKSGSIFCSECDNLIHDKTMEEIYHSVTLIAEEKETHFTGKLYYVTFNFECSKSLVAAKKRRESYKPWSPDEKEVAALRDLTSLSCQGSLSFLCLIILLNWLSQVVAGY